MRPLNHFAFSPGEIFLAWQIAISRSASSKPSFVSNNVISRGSDTLKPLSSEIIPLAHFVTSFKKSSFCKNFEAKMHLNKNCPLLHTMWARSRAIGHSLVQTFSFISPICPSHSHFDRGPKNLVSFLRAWTNKTGFGLFGS